MWQHFSSLRFPFFFLIIKQRDFLLSLVKIEKPGEMKRKNVAVVVMEIESEIFMEFYKLLLMVRCD